MFWYLLYGQQKYCNRNGINGSDELIELKVVIYRGTLVSTIRPSLKNVVIYFGGHFDGHALALKGRFFRPSRSNTEL